MGASRLHTRTVPLWLLATLASPGPAAAQTATVRAEENFRSEPNGTVLGLLRPGTELPVVQERDRWVEAELEGWVFIPSLQVTERAGFELIVSAPGGENLRAEPSGQILARLDEGTLLEEVERTAGWVHVRRRGWIWAPSLERDVELAPSPAATAMQSEGAASDSAGFQGLLTTGPRGMGVLTAPDGDTLARAAAHADLQLLAREGGWARVRLEGWVWAPETGDSTVVGEPALGILPAQVALAPDRFRGRVVTWDLQFISLERAERIRTDFFEGEPFLLTRPVEGEGPFVYVAVPPDRLDELEGLVALERISVTGRIRAGASALTGSPILDLIELRRSGGARRRGR